MNFLSLEFLLFFVVLLLVLQCVRGQSRHNIILLAASYLFYGWADLRFLFLLFALSLGMWAIGQMIEKGACTGRKAKTWLWIGIVCCLAVLGAFKHFGFFVSIFGDIFHLQYSVTGIMLPLGISFYIFQAISYLCDIYRKNITAEKSIVKVLLYIGFFPQIVSGPIVKAHDFFPQLENRKILSGERLSWGVQKFCLGVFKKAVIADRLGLCVDTVYSAPTAYSGLSLAMAALSYAIQIYYDFSGYSDMAIGIAHILGFDFARNFNLPYLAKNPSDFWRRWHISLSSWFKDYVYIPMGGSRRGKVRAYLNIFVTMLLSGLWHGASWSFVFWGAAHALLSVLYKVFYEVRKKYGLEIKSKYGKSFCEALSIVLTFTIVTILWIPFRINSLEQTGLIIQRIISLAIGVNYVYIFTIIFGILLAVVEGTAKCKNQGNDIWKPLNFNKFSSKIVFCCFLLVIFVFAYIGDGAFIYAQF